MSTALVQVEIVPAEHKSKGERRIDGTLLKIHPPSSSSGYLPDTSLVEDKVKLVAEIKRKFLGEI